MNSFEKIVTYLNGVNWSSLSYGYTPTTNEMDEVVRSLKAIADLVERYGGRENLHVLSSPARLLGFTPAPEVERIIFEQSGKIQNAYAQVFVRNAMEWAAMVFMGNYPSSVNVNVNLFDPLLCLIIKGCVIRLSKGFLEVGGNMIPLHNWFG